MLSKIVGREECWNNILKTGSVQSKAGIHRSYFSTICCLEESMLVAENQSVSRFCQISHSLWQVQTSIFFFTMIPPSQRISNVFICHAYPSNEVRFWMSFGTTLKRLGCIYVIWFKWPKSNLPSRVAQTRYEPGICKQEKSTWIPIFSDWLQVSFICGN